MDDIIAKILKVFEDNNLFYEGVELIGSWCFRLYQRKLGAKQYPFRTIDVDFLIPNPYRGKEHKDIIDQLQVLGFSRDFRSDGSVYLWNEELKIEFITPQIGRGADSSIRIKKLGISAIPLRFVSLLLDNPITIVDEGIRILVPNPANFCLQKLIIATRRRNEEKTSKDLGQAICTSVIVKDEELQELFFSLPKKWKRAIERMLEKAEEELPLLRDEINELEFTLIY